MINSPPSDGVSGARLDAAMRDFNEYQADPWLDVGQKPAIARELYGIIAVASATEWNNGDLDLEMFTPRAFVNYVEDLMGSIEEMLAEDDMEDIDD